MAVFLSRRMCIHGRGEFKRSSSGGQTRRRGGFPNAALRRRSFHCWRAILPRFWHVALTECKNQSSRSAFALSPLVIWAVLSLLCLPCSQIPLPLQYLQKLFCLQQGFFFGNQSHVTFCHRSHTCVTLSQVVNTSSCISPSDIYIYILMPPHVTRAARRKCVFIGDRFTGLPCTAANTVCQDQCPLRTLSF